MIEININVELGPKTVQLIGALLGGSSNCHCHCAEEAPVEKIDGSDPEVQRQLNTQSTEDMPDFEGKEITDADLRQIVKETKDRVGAKPIRDIFAEMGFSSSVECPAERRSELVERLKNLK